ncbi:hypothetical protein BU17DRAFT_90774 [Hysterangium stoloniferum]|nr:hypothetical protein BU17DRAFT_90774 [Hysterangium stoloniferum]
MARKTNMLLDKTSRPLTPVAHPGKNQALIDFVRDILSHADLPRWCGVAASQNPNKLVCGRFLYPFPHLQREFDQWEAKHRELMPGMNANLSTIGDAEGLTKPSLPLTELMIAAINGSPRGRLTIMEMKVALMLRFPFFANEPSKGGWHGSWYTIASCEPPVRHKPAVFPLHGYPRAALGCRSQIVLPPPRWFPDERLPLPSLQDMGLSAYARLAPPRPLPPLFVPQDRYNARPDGDTSSMVRGTDLMMGSDSRFTPDQK